MSKKPTTQDPFQSIDNKQLTNVQGGASRVTSRSGGSNDQLTAMLTQITSSIKDLASQQNQGMDPMMMMMMMMMMGGGGGGGAAGGGGYPAQVAAPQPAMPVINITTDVRRRW
jgi:hypothetical protein